MPARRERCSLGVLERKGNAFVEPDAEIRARGATLADRRRTPARAGRHRRARLHRHLAGLDPAARRARPRDHLRPDGRHQHGARRAHHDRRVRDVRRAEPLPPALARRVRLLPRRRAPGRVRRQRGGRHAARAHRHPASSTGARSRRCSRRGACQPDPDPGGAHDLRRAERAGREPGVDVGRRRDHDRRRAAVQPHRDHRVRGGRAAARLGAAARARGSGSSCAR